jgi:hypothetical protein
LWTNFEVDFGEVKLSFLVNLNFIKIKNDRINIKIKELNLYIKKIKINILKNQYLQKMSAKMSSTEKQVNN